MSDCKLNYGMDWFLVIIIAAGITVSTFHSHYTLDWYQNQSDNVAEVGSTISPDISHCPICGYFFQTDMPSAHTDSDILKPSRLSTIGDELFPTYEIEVVNKGRSPPVLSK